MPQHFLLSAAARTLSLSAVARMSGEEAHAKFTEIRWSDNDGKPYCPACGCLKVYAFATRKLWKCAACRYQFSVTARTIFQDRKRPIRDYLLAIAIFVNGAKGHSALQLSRDLDCQYRTAFVLAHKLREAIGSQVFNPDYPELEGEVAIDGAYFGGKVRQRTVKRIASTAAPRRSRLASGRSWWSPARSWAVLCRSSCPVRALRSR
jgi:ribosomal protein L37AE/L43A